MPAFRRNWNAVTLCQQIAENADSIIFLHSQHEKDLPANVFELAGHTGHPSPDCAHPHLNYPHSHSQTIFIFILILLCSYCQLQSSNPLTQPHLRPSGRMPSRRLTRRVKVNPEWWRRRSLPCWPSAEEALWSREKDSQALLEVSSVQNTCVGAKIISGAEDVKKHIRYSYIFPHRITRLKRVLHPNKAQFWLQKRSIFCLKRHPIRLHLIRSASDITA